MGELSKEGTGDGGEGTGLKNFRAAALLKSREVETTLCEAKSHAKPHEDLHANLPPSLIRSAKQANQAKQGKQANLKKASRKRKRRPKLIKDEQS